MDGGRMSLPSAAYSPLVRELLGRSRAVSRPDPNAAEWAIGEAGGVESGTWVRFALRLQDGRVTEARFKAYGCPHTLAAVAWLAEHARGRPLEESTAQGLEEVVRRLDIPAEKLGRLLIVQDALRDCRQRKIGPGPHRA
jgi:NifU-like protein involved in Fe-S cluster formation